MYATRLRRPAEPAGSPSTVTVPDATTWVPTIARMSVDLPLPLGPRRPVTVPRATSSVILSSASRPPRTTWSRSTSTACAPGTRLFYRRCGCEVSRHVRGVPVRRRASTGKESPRGQRLARRPEQGRAREARAEGRDRRPLDDDEGRARRGTRDRVAGQPVIRPSRAPSRSRRMGTRRRRSRTPCRSRSRTRTRARPPRDPGPPA